MLQNEHSAPLKLFPVFNSWKAKGIMEDFGYFQAQSTFIGGPHAHFPGTAPLRVSLCWDCWCLQTRMSCLPGDGSSLAVGNRHLFFSSRRWPLILFRVGLFLSSHFICLFQRPLFHSSEAAALSTCLLVSPLFLTGAWTSVILSLLFQSMPKMCPFYYLVLSNLLSDFLKVAVSFYADGGGPKSQEFFISY